MQTQPLTGPQPSDLSRIAQDLQIRKVQVENVVQLLDEGNTVPFITRYRKERTSGLDEEKIRRIQERVGELRQLYDRKNTILKSIEGQGKLTDALRDAILAAETSKRLEDLYLPYKPKKRTLATEAKEKGLEPFAHAVWNRDPAVSNLQEVLPGMLNPEKGLNSPEDILNGARHIIAEIIAENAEVRAAVRSIVWESGLLISSKSDKVTEEKGQEYKDYFEFKESARDIPPHRVLAVNRGERETFLTIKIEWDFPRARDICLQVLMLHDHPHREFVESALDDALSRLINPSMEREVRREQTEAAQEHAVAIFARNLRSLLLQPPLQRKRVLAIDPGMRTGCKLAALDETGLLLEDSVIYPHAPQNRTVEAKFKLHELIRKHQLSVIAIGNGTACRETEQLVSEVIAECEAIRNGTMALPTPPPPPPPKPPRTPKSSAKQQSVPATTEKPVETPAVPSAEQAIATTEVATTSVDPSIVVSTTETPVVPEQPTVPTETPVIPEQATTPAETVETTEPPVTSTEMPVVQEEPVAATETPVPHEQVTVSTETPVSVEQPAVSADAVATTEPVTLPTEPTPPPEVKPTAPPLDTYADAPTDLAYVIVNEAGASDYSASPIAREEFPNHDATTRGTISIGRRLQDPLAELVKIDPQHVGVGLYQHDVKAKELKESLEGIIESCVNHVGVDLNTASVPLLRHVAGMNQLVARDLVEFRKQNGSFRTREQLQSVPGIGPARFTQAAGFLKLSDGEEPLDATWIHPESYHVARQILTELGFSPADLRDKSQLENLQQKLKEVNIEDVSTRMNVGIPTVKDILEALARPGRDPREDLPPPIFKKGILKLEDLQPGMELKGTVLNVVDFGAFVDIGLKDSGLVHISQMANRYIKSPYEVVSVGDVVVVWVMKVESDRRRVSLTMIPPGVERSKPPERKPLPPRPQVERGPRPTGQGGPRTPRGGGGPPQGQGRQPIAQGQGPSPRGEGRPFRGGPPRGPRPQGGRGPVSTGGDAGNTTGGQQNPQPTQQQPQPQRKPSKPKALPKLSQDALTGKKPLVTFGELEAFFKAKDAPPTPQPQPAETPLVPETPTEETPPATPPTAEGANP